MLKFNLTQEGKTLIDALQGDAKLTITKVLLRDSELDNNTSKEITSFKGAVCNDGTGNGAYVVIDITDNSNSNYSCNAIELFSDQTKIATQCVDEQTGYEVTLYCGESGRSKYPSITYRTQTWASGKTPTNAQLSARIGYPDKQCGIRVFGGGIEESVTFDFENGNFPKTITFANGDVWVTSETVSAAGVTEKADYYASSEMGGTSIRPLFSKILIEKDSNKQLKLRVSCQFDGAEKCKFNTTSINLPYATRFREGVIRLADPSEVYGKDGQRYNTVYSAADVDAKIDAVTGSLGNLKDYAKINAENTFAENNTFTKNVIVNGEIGGTAVTDAGTGGDKHIVNVGYADGKYLSKTDASSTYLTQTDAANTYLTKTDANAAAGNYAKLDGGNTFTGDVNTFKEVSATKFSGDGVSSDISVDAVNNGTKLPTCAAVATFVDGKTGTLVQTITALQNKDNDLQSQIDGINAGQNLADIVNSTTELATYDISHLKAKDDYQHGTEGATWAIGDKVQVLGGGDVQSSVYELVKGTKPAEDNDSIQSTNYADYYWRYIGVYGTNAYTKAEIDAKVGEINSAIGTKADKTYVNDEFAKKVDKTQITTTISGDTATNENIPSASAVKTYVDTVANDLPNKYVTVDTTQEITGAKTFANGNITIANPNTDHKDKHYVTIGATGNNTTSDYTSSITHYDLTHNDYANDIFKRAKPNADPNKSSDNASYTRDLTRYDTNAGKYTFGSRIEQHIGTHYNYTASDMYMTTGDPNNVSPLPAAQIGTPGNTGSTDSSLKENYVERIRLRKNTSTVNNIEGGFLSAGQSVTDIDLFADNINNVFSKEVSFRVCTTPGDANTEKYVLRIYSSGIWYRTQDGNSISTAEYQLRTAGSLDFTTSMSTLVGSDSYVPTTKAVADFVNDKITGITGGTAFVKTSAPGTDQTIDSAITVTEGITVGSNEKPATLTVSGAITGSGVATQVINTDIPDQVTTARAVASFVTNAITENRNAISDKAKIGAMGLFLYTGGDFKEMGTEVNGSLLHTVGMQLPMDGVVSWSQGTAVNTAVAAETTWKLLNNTIAGEPCLVLAIRVM